MSGEFDVSVLADKLEVRIDRTGAGPQGTCWIWTGATKEGYGYMWRDWRRRALGYIKVHRLAWELANGPIPDGLKVCHKCDNPVCVRLDHLFLGTDADNMRDRDRKGRSTRSTASGRYIKTVQTELPATTPRIGREVATRIRHMRAEGIPASEIAREFGVSRNHVYRISSGSRWA